VDIYTNDLGFIAIIEQARLIGFNVVAGGGMGTTHGDHSTFPRLADDLGFITVDKVLKVAEAVITIQRNQGNRVSRRHARLKYTIERLGLENFKHQVEQYSNVNFQPSRKIRFERQGDRYGWSKGTDDKWNLTLYIENGRVVDLANAPVMTGLRKIASLHKGDFRITPNQNLIIAGVAECNKSQIDQLAKQHGLINNATGNARLNSLACVSLPTCPQAMAEAERYFPEFMDKVESLLERHGLQNLDLVIRMTGCPNGCARPFVAEIGLVGKAPGRYNLLLGGDGRGQRLNKLYRENLKEQDILSCLNQLFEQYSADRKSNERLGDFAIRSGLVKQVINSVVDFHA